MPVQLELPLPSCPPCADVLRASPRSADPRDCGWGLLLPELRGEGGFEPLGRPTVNHRHPSPGARLGVMTTGVATGEEFPAELRPATAPAGDGVGVGVGVDGGRGRIHCPCPGRFLSLTGFLFPHTPSRSPHAVVRASFQAGMGLQRRSFSPLKSFMLSKFFPLMTFSFTSFLVLCEPRRMRFSQNQGLQGKTVRFPLKSFMLSKCRLPPSSAQGFGGFIPRRDKKDACCLERARIGYCHATRVSLSPEALAKGDHPPKPWRRRI